MLDVTAKYGTPLENIVFLGIFYYTRFDLSIFQIRLQVMEGSLIYFVSEVTPRILAQIFLNVCVFAGIKLVKSLFQSILVGYHILLSKKHEENKSF